MDTEIRVRERSVSRAGMLKGGESEEAAIVPGKPEESPLYHRVISTLTDLDCRYPGILAPYAEQYQQAKLAHWRHIKGYNFLASQYGLPQRDQNAAKKAAKK